MAGFCWPDFGDFATVVGHRPITDPYIPFGAVVSYYFSTPKIISQNSLFHKWGTSTTIPFAAGQVAGLK